MLFLCHQLLYTVDLDRVYLLVEIIVDVVAVVAAYARLVGQLPRLS